MYDLNPAMPGIGTVGALYITPLQRHPSRNLGFLPAKHGKGQNPEAFFSGFRVRMFLFLFLFNNDFAGMCRPRPTAPGREMSV
jgi:hypothetical protein